jgi:hypothetical protein
VYAPPQVSYSLNHLVDVLFGRELKSDQQKRLKVVSQPRTVKPIPSRPASSRFSLKGMLIWLGLRNQPNGGFRQAPPSPQLPVARLEARIQRLESLLKAEQALWFFPMTRALFTTASV